MAENDNDFLATQDDPQPDPQPEPQTEVSTHERLRAFEDEKLGEDAPRIHGKVEKGHGSLFQRLSDEDRARHAAIEHLVETEKQVAEARAALAAAEDRHAAAERAASE